MFLLWLEDLFQINLNIDDHLNKLSSETVQLQHKLSHREKSYSGPLDPAEFNILYDPTGDK